MEEKTLHIEGTVENVLYKNEDNGYAVVDLDAGGELITAVGMLGDAEEGEVLILEGQYVTHRKFGTQFRAEYCERKLPSDTVNIEKYLSSGAIKGIGPGLASKIVRVFGEKTLDIIENEPFRLSEIKGISAKKCEEIAAEAKKLFSLRCIMSFLSQYDIKSQFAMKTYHKFGGDSLELLKVNPYLLCGDAIELDFDKADTIASDMNIEKNSNKRVIAGLQHILRANTAIGHSCLPLDILLKKAEGFLEISEQDFYSSYNAGLDENELFEYIKNERGQIVELRGIDSLDLTVYSLDGYGLADTRRNKAVSLSFIVNAFRGQRKAVTGNIRSKKLLLHEMSDLIITLYNHSKGRSLHSADVQPAAVSA